MANEQFCAQATSVTKSITQLGMEVYHNKILLFIEVVVKEKLLNCRFCGPSILAATFSTHVSDDSKNAV